MAHILTLIIEDRNSEGVCNCRIVNSVGVEIENFSTDPSDPNRDNGLRAAWELGYGIGPFLGDNRFRVTNR